MDTYVLDIETKGTKYEDLPESTQEYLTRYAKDDEHEEHLKTLTALYPFTGEVIAIGVRKYPDGSSKVLYRGVGDDIIEGDITFVAVADEKELLTRFWTFAEKNIGKLVTFNGRGFDVPYLVIRSGINAVKVTKEFMGYRYSEDVHCDLAEQLTFYGATKKWSLDLVSRGFGLESPKADGISGENVTELFEDGRVLEIARYCLRDVNATHDIYRRWEQFMRQPKERKY